MLQPLREVATAGQALSWRHRELYQSLKQSMITLLLLSVFFPPNPTLWSSMLVILNGSTEKAHMYIVLHGFLVHLMCKRHFLPLALRRCILWLGHSLTQLSILSILLFFPMVATSVRLLYHKYNQIYATSFFQILMIPVRILLLPARDTHGVLLLTDFARRMANNPAALDIPKHCMKTQQFVLMMKLVTLSLLQLEMIGSSNQVTIQPNWLAGAPMLTCSTVFQGKRSYSIVQNMPPNLSLGQHHWRTLIVAR